MRNNNVDRSNLSLQWLCRWKVKATEGARPRRKRHTHCYQVHPRQAGRKQKVARLWLPHGLKICPQTWKKHRLRMLGYHEPRSRAYLSVASAQTSYTVATVNHCKLAFLQRHEATNTSRLFCQALIRSSTNRAWAKARNHVAKACRTNLWK